MILIYWFSLWKRNKYLGTLLVRSFLFNLYFYFSQLYTSIPLHKAFNSFSFITFASLSCSVCSYSYLSVQYVQLWWFWKFAINWRMNSLCLEEILILFKPNNLCPVSLSWTVVFSEQLYVVILICQDLTQNSRFHCCRLILVQMEST